MLPSKYAAVIFDLDGTLVTLPVDWEAVRRELIEYFKTEDAFLPLFKTIDTRTTQKPEARSRVFSLIDNYEVAAAKESKLLVGVLDIFNHLFGKAKLALVTMQGRRVCSQLLGMYGLSRFLELSLTREDSLDRSVQLETVINRLVTEPRDSLLVGDRMNDVNSAKQVGVPVALVSRKKVKGVAPDLQFKTLVALRDYLSGNRK